MSESKTTDIAEKLSNIHQSFKNRLSSKIDEIELCWTSIKNKKSSDYSEFYLMLHSLVGTSGTYSAIMVSKACKKIEIIAKLLLNNEIQLSDDTINSVDELLVMLRQVSEKWQPSSIPFIPESTSKKLVEQADWIPNIYLVEDDVEIISPLIDFLEQAGYKVFYYKEVKDFEKSYVTNERASAIIMDMSFKEGHIAGAEIIKKLSDNDENFPPVIFISVHDDIDSRLAAAQVGAKRYFTKPINNKKLLTSLDNLTFRSESEAYRVILIDDEQDILDYYASLLQQHGFDTLSFTSPLDAYQKIDEFKADLIVLDLYMPECSGIDLARVIRQNDDFAHIPIVFLSSELDTGTQLSAMDLGGDDFLMKPVEASHFVQAMVARVKRSRRLNNLNKTLRETVRESEYRLVTLDQHAIVSMADVNGNLTYVNEHFCKISGYNENELLGKSFKLIRSKSWDEIWSVISEGDVWHGQVWYRSKTNTEYCLEMTIVPFIGEQGLPYKFVFTGTDVTQMKISESMVKEAKQDAEQANQAKTEFLARMSHELRTPMNAICGFSQLLKTNADDGLNEVQLDYINEIINASEHLLKLINEILNLSKIEAGKIDLTIEKINLIDVTFESLSMITPLTENKKIQFMFKLNSKKTSFDDFVNSEIYIDADRVRTKQVLLNLLSNSVKYNNDNGSVIIDCYKTDNNSVRISVIDSGKGIASDHLPQLFTEFNRLGEEHSNVEGAGIGLMIAKKLTELMQGNIGVESKLGQGSTFWLEFPASK